ncbi:putative reverse transcriptase domain-containing protein [Tanacetum coccineum]
MPVELGSFDVIIGMDWLRRCHAVIVCDEKLVQVPYGNETLTFCGNECNNRIESQLTIILCSKAQEYMAKGCQVFLTQISAKKRISKKRTKNEAKTDKTEHEMEKSGKAKVKSKPKSTPTKSKPRSHQVK